MTFFEGTARRLTRSIFPTPQRIFTSGVGQPRVLSPRQKRVKRTFDVIVSLALFGLILPLILIVVLLLYFEDGSPILQKQCQIGAGGQLFCVYTFRTKLRHDTERPSAFGRFLIATCLDRLPIFLNIFTGQMSLVGPALIAYAPGVTLTDRSRASLCMSPGLFQARDERAYLENYSIWSDIQVLLTNCNAHLQ